jgi:uncharacterized UPF0146 family protein
VFCRLIKLRGASEIANFILQNYSGKAVEVGAGFVSEVALLIGRHMKVVATDKGKRILDGLSVEDDDIFSPHRDIYEGASILYSIRPPIEVQIAMGRLAAEIGADILIRPLDDEIADLPGFTKILVNQGDARFYHFKRKS